MNFLAHAYCSRDRDGAFQVGNILGDFFKGPQPNALPDPIWQGVLFHRRLDRYVDDHVSVRTARKLLHQSWGHYAGAILDVFFDHFLARDFERYCGDASLSHLIARSDRHLQNHLDQIPPRPMPQQLYWLGEYASKAGVRDSLRRLSRRSRRKADLSDAVEILKHHEEDLLQYFESLLQDLNQTLLRTPLFQEAEPRQDDSI